LASTWPGQELKVGIAMSGDPQVIMVVSIQSYGHP